MFHYLHTLLFCYRHHTGIEMLLSVRNVGVAITKQKNSMNVRTWLWLNWVENTSTPYVYAGVYIKHAHWIKSRYVAGIQKKYTIENFSKQLSKGEREMKKRHIAHLYLQRVCNERFESVFPIQIYVWISNNNEKLF